MKNGNFYKLKSKTSGNYYENLQKIEIEFQIEKEKIKNTLLRSRNGRNHSY